MIRALSNIALVGSLVGCVVFVFRYGFLSGWWKTGVGRNLLAFMAACMVLLGLSASRMVFPGWFEAHRDGLRLFSFALVFVVVWWRVVLLLKAQRRDAPKRDRLP